MSTKERRNIGKHTSSATATSRILHCILLHGPIASKSWMGYVAYPDYSFKSPQAAAFAVAKVAKDMHIDGLIDSSICYGKGIGITQKGRDYIANEEASKKNGGQA